MVRNDAQRAELRQALDAARAQYGQEAMELLPHIMALGDYCYTICDYKTAVDVYSYGLFVIEVRRAGGSKEEAQLFHRIGCALLKQGCGLSAFGFKRGHYVALCHGKSQKTYLPPRLKVQVW